MFPIFVFGLGPKTIQIKEKKMFIFNTRGSVQVKPKPRNNFHIVNNDCYSAVSRRFPLG